MSFCYLWYRFQRNFFHKKPFNQASIVKPAAHPSPETGNRSGHATIAQVALEAGVSKTSVSRYLGDDIGALSEELQLKIATTIARLGYQPNQMARGLKRGRTRLIGMMVADILNPYSVAVLEGAEAACQQHGYTLMLCNTGNDEKRERQSLAALRSYSAEGLIIHTHGGNVDALRDLSRSGLPMVLVDREIDGLTLDLVGLDNVSAAIQATRHLIDNGFTDIALVTAPLAGFSSRERRAEGFQQAISSHPNCHGTLLELCQDDPVSLEAQLKQFLAENAGRRLALLAANGVITMRIALLLKQLDLRFPDDLGLLGFDEMDWSPLVGPGISTIAQPTYEIGYSAMKCLLAHLEGERFAPREVLLPGQLIVRGSSAGAKPGDIVG